MGLVRISALNSRHWPFTIVYTTPISGLNDHWKDLLHIRYRYHHCAVDCNYNSLRTETTISKRLIDAPDRSALLPYRDLDLREPPGLHGEVWQSLLWTMARSDIESDILDIRGCCIHPSRVAIPLSVYSTTYSIDNTRDDSGVDIAYVRKF